MGEPFANEVSGFAADRAHQPHQAQTGEPTPRAGYCAATQPGGPANSPGAAAPMSMFCAVTAEIMIQVGSTR